MAGATPPLGSQTPRITTTRPNSNPFTPPIPVPTTDPRNLAACVTALKACTESLIGQRGDAANRAVTFRDLVSYGLLDVGAVQSANGSAAAGMGFQVGPGLKLDVGSTPPVLDVATPYLPVVGGVITGGLTVDGQTTLHGATATTPATADNSIAIATTAFVKAQGYATTTQLANYLPLTGGVITGPLSVTGTATLAVATANTPAMSDNSGNIATTAFVKAQGYATTTQLGAYLPLAGGTVAGNLTVNGATTLALATATTPAHGDNSTKIATTAFVVDALSGGSGAYLPLTGGTLSGPLTINLNAAAPSMPTGTVLQLSQADNTVVRLLLDGVGTVVNPNLTFRVARGTGAARSAVQSGDFLGSVTCFGYGATGYTSSNRGSINFQAGENWTDTANGTQITLATTTPGTTSAPTRMAILQGVTIGNLVSDPGHGRLILNGNSTPWVAALAPPTTSTLTAYPFDGSTANNITIFSASAPILSMVSYRGTLGAPTATQSGDWLAMFTASGYDSAALGNAARLQAEAAETWTTAHHGAQWRFATTTPGGTTLRSALIIGQGMQVLDASGNPPSGGDLGPGTINAAGQIRTASGLTVAGGSTFGANVVLGNSIGLYGRDTSGTAQFIASVSNDNNIYIGDGSRALNLRGAISASSTITGTGNIASTGSAASLQFDDRSGGVFWLWYAQGNITRLYTSANGDRFLFNNGGTFYPAIDNGMWCGVAGNSWYACSSYNYSNASDIRHKTDIADLPECLPIVERLHPQRYKFTNGPDHDRDVTHWGFVAQDVAAALADHEFGGHHTNAETGEQSISYHELTAVLWKAVQELSQRVATVEDIIQP